MKLLRDIVTFGLLTFLLAVACPINEYINGWGFALRVDSWAWVWIWLSTFTFGVALLAFARFE